MKPRRYMTDEEILKAVFGDEPNDWTPEARQHALELMSNIVMHTLDRVYSVITEANQATYQCMLREDIDIGPIIQEYDIEPGTMLWELPMWFAHYLVYTTEADNA